MAEELLPLSMRTPPLQGVVLWHPADGTALGSEALKKLSRHLRRPWCWCFRWTPAWVYRWVALRRNQLARHFPTCELPEQFT